MKSLVIRLEVRVPDALSPSHVTHKFMDFANEQDWNVDAASGTFPALEQPVVPKAPVFHTFVALSSPGPMPMSGRKCAKCGLIRSHPVHKVGTNAPQR